jgi:hypothetical protein
VPVKPQRSPLLSFVVAAVLLLAALYLGYATPPTADAGRWHLVAGALAGAAVLVLILRVIRRR